MEKNKEKSSLNNKGSTASGSKSKPGLSAASKAQQLFREPADFFFYFDANNQLSKVRMGQPNLGGIDFISLKPVQERKFTDEDFASHDCEMIPSIILEEAKTFVTFM